MCLGDFWLARKQTATREGLLCIIVRELQEVNFVDYLCRLSRELLVGAHANCKIHRRSVVY